MLFVNNMQWQPQKKIYRTTVVTKIVSANKQVIKGEYQNLREKVSNTTKKYVDQEISASATDDIAKQNEELREEIKVLRDKNKEAERRLNELRDKVNIQVYSVKSKPVFSDLDSNLALLRYGVI